MEAFRDDSQPVRGPPGRPRSDSQHLLLVPAHRVHPCPLRTVPVLSVHVSILHPGGRAGRSKQRVTPNDTERRAPSTLATGRLNQGVLRDLWTLGVRPRGQSGVPLLRMRLQPFRRGRGSTGPLG